MTGNPNASADTDKDTDAVFLSIDAEPSGASEAGEAPPPVVPIHSPSRPTKFDRAPSSRNTALDLPRQNSPAPEASAVTEPAPPPPAPVPTPAPRAEVAAIQILPAEPAQVERHQPMSREALSDAVFTAPGATEWLSRLALAMAMTVSTLWYEILTTESRRNPRQVTLA